MSGSCIVGQFSHYAALSDDEIKLLESLEKNERRISAKSVIRDIGKPTNNFFTLKSGWAIAEQNLPDGQRQIIDVFLPGQILGLREIAYQSGLCTYSTLTDAVLCPFPKTDITKLFEQSKRLTDLFFLILAREQATLTERVINLGRRSATEKIAHFLLELQVRLKITNQELQNSFRLPMTQRAIGDTLGMTSVHVSRSMAYLKAERLVRKRGGVIELLDDAALREMAGFNLAYLQMDVSWLRGAASG